MELGVLPPDVDVLHNPSKGQVHTRIITRAFDGQKGGRTPSTLPAKVLRMSSA